MLIFLFVELFLKLKGVITGFYLMVNAGRLCKPLVYLLTFVSSTLTLANL